MLKSATVARPLYDDLHRLIAPLIGLPAGSVVLDAGCGDGAVAGWLAERGGHHVLGVDRALPEDATSAGLRLLPGGGAVELWRADIVDLALPRRFNGVLLLGALHHAGSARAVHDMLRAVDTYATQSAPLALRWVCAGASFGYLPSRSLVHGILADLGWAAADAWHRDVPGGRGPLRRRRRVDYGVWRRCGPSPFAGGVVPTCQR